MPNDVLQIIYDHYKDTYLIIEKTVSMRDRNFILAILLLIATFALTINPELGIEIAKDIGKKKIEIDFIPSYHVINSALLFTAIWFWIRYFQHVLLLEHLYEYIHRVEVYLSEQINDYDISREGKSYLRPYPILKSLIHRIYTIIIPVSLVLLAYSKGYYEWSIHGNKIPLPAKIADTFGILVLIVSALLYLSWIHFKDFNKG